MTSDTVAGSLMLIELTEAVPFAEAVITVDEVLERSRLGSMHTSRTGGMNVVHRSGAVRSMSPTIEKEELLRMLGREKFYPQMDADRRRFILPYPKNLRLSASICGPVRRQVFLVNFLVLFQKVSNMLAFFT